MFLELLGGRRARGGAAGGTGIGLDGTNCLALMPAAWAQR